MGLFQYCLASAITIAIATPALAEVRGLYGSECLDLEGLSAQKDLLFKGNSLETVQTVYGDSACESPAYDFSFVGPYVFDKATGALNYTYETIKLRALDERIAEAFNQIALCGYTDWSVNEAHEVAGRDCGGQVLPEAGAQFFDLFHEAKDSISLGLITETEDGLHAESRPTELDPHRYFAK